MKRRTILGAIVGLLLPLPFMLDHCAAKLQQHQTLLGVNPWGANIVPILTQEERRALLTYRRPCDNQKDCAPPLACLHLSPGGERVCIDSSCMTDLQCKQGFTCRTRQGLEDGPLVRRCVLVGQRKEGQPCLETTTRLESACEPGLLCGNGYCGRPCQLDGPSSCPAGFVCRAGPETSFCQPFCKGGDCPEGQDCVGAGTDDASCMVIRGPNCLRDPCPEGLSCNPIDYTPRAEAWTARVECVIPCGKGKWSCPKDSVCFLGGCQRECGPDAGEVCAPGQQCIEQVPGRLWLCR